METYLVLVSIPKARSFLADIVASDIEAKAALVTLKSCIALYVETDLVKEQLQKYQGVVRVTNAKFKNRSLYPITKEGYIDTNQ